MQYLSYETLVKLPTARLLAYKKKYFKTLGAYPKCNCFGACLCEECSNFKEKLEWESKFHEIKNILEQREHVERKPKKRRNREK